jgi:hypothetical protein
MAGCPAGMQVDLKLCPEFPLATGPATHDARIAGQCEILCSKLSVLQHLAFLLDDVLHGS